MRATRCDSEDMASIKSRKPQYRGRTAQPDPSNLEAMQAILDSRPRAYYEAQPAA